MMKIGLADHKRVTVLDFACGTGTFIVEVLERIFENIGRNSGKRSLIIRDHILKNVYGFEYLIAPYTIAHLKLSQYLDQQGHKLAADERFLVFLTNTLEPIKPQKNYLLPALSGEIEAAQTVKESPILVITGNPPYAAYSKNKGAWITAKIEDYKMVDGKHFGERKHWLQDDYVKFMRFAQSKMDDVGEGIVAVITNHSWIYNPTFRGMRQSLMNSFQQIHIIDLHGSTKPKEVAPDGKLNENVFDIMKGVAVTLFIKKPSLPKGIWFGDVWGSRLDKYKTCMDSIFSDFAIEEVKPEKPFYFFSPRVSPDVSGWFGHNSLEDIFLYQSAGVLTARDHFNVQFNREQLLDQIRAFSRMDAEAARKKFEFGKDSRDWKVEYALEDVTKAKASPQFVKDIGYRPFDDRVIFYTGKSRGLIGQPAAPLAEHIEIGGVALGTTRRVEEGDYRHAFVFSRLPDGHSVSSKETTHVFPLKLKGTFGEARDNWKPEFRTFMKERYGSLPKEETIFGYIYAVLNCSIYRDKFEESLADDYPRIPFPETLPRFEELSALGWDLAQKHLLQDVPGFGLAQYHGDGGHTVERVAYVEAEKAVYINDTQRFAPIPAAVWSFQVGTYPVIERYLKARADRELTLDEIDRVSSMANAIAFTFEQMKMIDSAYQRSFPG